MVYRLFYALSVIGVLVLAIIATLSCVSITGRALSQFGLRPVLGDFELVEAGTAIAVFCFLPLCHLMRGHANVDVFFNHFPRSLQRLVHALCDLLMLVLWATITWRSFLAALEFMANGELTYILQFPVWWPVLFCALIGLLGCVGYVFKLMETLGLVAPPVESAQAMTQPQH